MHFLTGKAEERLHFDIQREIAERLGYTSHPGLSAVERFMKHYFLVAKDVGDLTRIFCAALEEEQAKPRVRASTGCSSTFSRRRRKLAGTSDFVVDNRPHQHRRRQGVRARPGQSAPAVLVRRPARPGIPSRCAEAGHPFARPRRPHAAPRPGSQPAVPRHPDFRPQSRTQPAAHERGRRCSAG